MLNHIMTLNEKLLQQADKNQISREKQPENLIKFLKVVSDTYDDYENELKNLRHTVSLCSSEMIELNNRLRKESKELKTLFETMAEVFFSVDMETAQLIQISTACETVFGYPIGSFMKNPNLWAELVIAKDRHIIESFHTKISLGHPFTSCYRICRKDGCIRWLETKITPTLNEQGKVIRIDGLTSDITVGKEALKLLLGND